MKDIFVPAIREVDLDARNDFASKNHQSTRMGKHAYTYFARIVIVQSTKYVV